MGRKSNAAPDRSLAQVTTSSIMRGDHRATRLRRQGGIMSKLFWSRSTQPSGGFSRDPLLLCGAPSESSFPAPSCGASRPPEAKSAESNRLASWANSIGWTLAQDPDAVALRSDQIPRPATASRGNGNQSTDDQGGQTPSQVLVRAEEAAMKAAQRWELPNGKDDPGAVSTKNHFLNITCCPALFDSNNFQESEFDGGVGEPHRSFSDTSPKRATAPTLSRQIAITRAKEDRHRPMNMRGMAATVTSCIGGKDEKFAVQVKLAAPESVYFVYKTMDEFDALWGSLEALARDVARPKSSKNQDKKPSLLAKWLASVVDHYAFRQIIRDLRAQEKETMSTLNVLLQFLVARVSALFMERSLLHCGSCIVGRQLVKLVREFLQAEPATPEPVVKKTSSSKDGRKRSFEEMRPEDGEMQRNSLFPSRSGDRAVKTQKLCGMREWAMPPVGKLGMVAPVASRRRVFAEVEF